MSRDKKQIELTRGDLLRPLDGRVDQRGIRLAGGHDFYRRLFSAPAAADEFLGYLSMKEFGKGQLIRLGEPTRRP